jgi:hypothetical protein
MGATGTGQRYVRPKRKHTTYPACPAGLDTHKHGRNLNVLVIGGSGSAKTRGYAKPNLLQANTNYVVTDPKQELWTP